MSVEITIVCDGCATLVAAGKTAAQARADARTLGARTALPGGRDLCDECASDPDQTPSSP